MRDQRVVGELEEMLTGECTRSGDLPSSNECQDGDAWATNLNAVLLRQERRFDEAHAAVSEALQFYRTTSVPAGLSLALRNLGFIAEQQGDGAAAIPFHTDAIAESRRVNDQRGIAAGLEGLAGAAAVMGEPDRARALLSEAEQLRAAGAGPPTAIERFDLDRIQAVLGSVPA
ncbi:MAG TPA: tetratricopeptide repeat protein [Ilumatobacteraceae bacterium]|nr:tetratricopeptide repeat protein [Ilumatobacteraceae bacterium]